MKSHVFGFALLSAIAIVATAPAQATGTLTRTFVSSSGVDTNPCTIAAPCATFAAAYAAVAANGIVAALDPGKYGPLTGTSAITGPVTINGNGWAAITGPANGSGITINANTSNGDTITLTGLEIDGAGAAHNGIVFNSGGNLTVTNCVLQNFVGAGTTGNGILIQPTSGTISFAITNTVATNNTNTGIFYFPPSGAATATGVIDHVVVTNISSTGIAINTGNLPGNGLTTVAISNSVASNNSNGVYIDDNNKGSTASPVLMVSIDNGGFSGNNVGIEADNTSKVLLGRSAITGNKTGVINSTSPNLFYSYQDNRINGNLVDILTALNHSLAFE
jgi:hypothetical protein